MALSVVTACQSKDKTQITDSVPLAPVTTQHSAEGGITSGGGGTLPANPISIAQVYDVINTSRQVLRLYINFQKQFPLDISKSTSRFFTDKTNLLTVLEDVDLEVLRDKPCKDKSGVEVDASIYGSRPGSICLSAFRVAPKLIKEIAHTEINALLLHELSHLLGASEDEAVALQESMVLFTDEINHDDLVAKLWGLPMMVEEISIATASIAKDCKTTTPEDLLKAIRNLNVKASAWADPLEYSLSVHDNQQRDYLELQMVRIRLAESYAGTLLTGPLQQSAIKEYDNIFQGGQELTLEQYGAYLRGGIYGVYDDNMFKSEKLKRLNSLEELSLLMSDLNNYFSEQWMLAAAISFDQPMPEMSGPWNASDVNPFISFVGEYEVQSINCTTDWAKDPQLGIDLKGLEITLDSLSNQIYVKSLVSGGFSTDGYYRNASGRATRFSGSPTTAIKVSEIGNHWFSISNNHGYTRTTNQISTNGGLYTYKIRYDDYKTNGERANFNFYECNYDLRKVK